MIYIYICLKLRLILRRYLLLCFFSPAITPRHAVYMRKMLICYERFLFAFRDIYTAAFSEAAPPYYYYFRPFCRRFAAVCLSYTCLLAIRRHAYYTSFSFVFSFMLFLSRDMRGESLHDGFRFHMPFLLAHCRFTPLPLSRYFAFSPRDI